MYRKNVAGQYLYFALVNASTGAALTGATVTGKRGIDGAAQASVTGTISEEAGGQYKIALSQADVNGNNIGFLFTATSAIPVSISIVTTAADPTDGVRLGLTALPNAAASAVGGLPLAVDTSGRVDILKVNGTSQTARDLGAQLDAAISTRSTYAGADTAGTTTLLARVPGTVQPQTGDSYARLGAPVGASISSDIAGIVASVWAAGARTLTAFGFTVSATADPNVALIKAKTDNLPATPAAVSDIPTANANADALLDRADAIETAWTIRKALRIIAAACAGKLSGAATATATIRNITDTKARITATVDADGNRTAVTLDGA